MQSDKPKSMSLLPPSPDKCQVCASTHLPEEPHNPDSLYWQTKRNMEGLPPATWEDALEHVTGDLREQWESILKGTYGFGCPICEGWKLDASDYMCHNCREQRDNDPKPVDSH